MEARIITKFIFDTFILRLEYGSAMYLAVRSIGARTVIQIVRRLINVWLLAGPV